MTGLDVSPWKLWKAVLAVLFELVDKLKGCFDPWGFFFF